MNCGVAIEGRCPCRIYESMKSGVVRGAETKSYIVDLISSTNRYLSLREVNMKKIILMSFVLSMVSSCASYHPINKQYSETATTTFASTKVLNRSLLNTENITEEIIQKILNSKIKIPTPARLAIVRLTNNSVYEEFSYSSRKISSKKYDMDDAFVNSFYKTLDASKKISRVIPLPTSLLPYNIDLKSLRIAAVTVQADLLLVINTNTDTNWDFKWSEGNSFGKGTTLLESYLMDIRTGIVPTTGVYSETAEVKKDNSKDYDVTETMRRARLESETKVFTSLAKDVLDFIESTK